MASNYSVEAYKNDPENIKYCELFNEPEDLIKQWYEIKYSGGKETILQRKKKKLCNIYDDVEDFEGHGLELGFGFGVSLYTLFEWYPRITMDALDFNPLLDKIVPLLKKLNDRLQKIWIGDSQEVEGQYDFINSCSFFEHLPDEVYWKTIERCYKILKPGGFFGVYLDQSKGPEHIRIRKPHITRKELEQVGFKAKTDYLFVKE